MSKPILVTGGYGFIGSALLRSLVEAGESVVNLDANTYAGDPRRVEALDGSFRSIEVDIAENIVMDIVKDVAPRVLVHLAAETHVTRSEAESDAFFRTNVEGTRTLLTAAGRTGVDLFVLVSTDEVYGPCEGAPFKEDQKLPGEGAATSAYARSKSLADDLATSMFGDHPVIVVRPTNVYGPWQHPEKAVARWSARALRGQSLPVWGDGRQVRDWMYVSDLCDALLLLLERGEPGNVYNIAPQGAERTNLEIATRIASAAGGDDQPVYLSAYDRPRHDRRYAIDASKLRGLGWKAAHDVESALDETVAWYRDHRWWWDPLVATAESLYDDDSPRGSKV
jgi:dTDP-glucose 4,6-dehydratase